MENNVATKEMKSAIARYSDEELKIFEIKISDTIRTAKENIKSWKESLAQLNAGSTSQDDVSQKNTSKERLNFQIEMNEKKILKANKALSKIKNETFGVCEGGCGELIPKKRL